MDIQIFHRTKEYGRKVVKEQDLDKISVRLPWNKGGWVVRLVPSASAARAVAHAGDGLPGVENPSWCIATGYSSAFYHFRNYTKNGKNPCLILVKDGKEKYCIIPEGFEPDGSRSKEIVMYPTSRAQDAKPTEDGKPGQNYIGADIDKELGRELVDYIEDYVGKWYEKGDKLGNYDKSRIDVLRFSVEIKDGVSGTTPATADLQIIPVADEIELDRAVFRQMADY